MDDLFSIKREKYYITLFSLGAWVGNYDSDQEVEEAKIEILGY